MPTTEQPVVVAIRSAGPPAPQATSSRVFPGESSSHSKNLSCSSEVSQLFCPISSPNASWRIWAYSSVSKVHRELYAFCAPRESSYPGSNSLIKPIFCLTDRHTLGHMVFAVYQRMERFGGGWGTAHSITGRSRPPLETQMSSNSTNPSAYSPKSFMLLAQNNRASFDNRMSSLACVQNCRAASRASSQTSNVFAVPCGSINPRGGTWPSPVGAYSIETWSNAGARRKREPSAKNRMLY